MPADFLFPGFILLVAVAAFATGWMNGRYDHNRKMAKLEARKDAERRRALALWQDLAMDRMAQLRDTLDATYQAEKDRADAA